MHPTSNRTIAKLVCLSALVTSIFSVSAIGDAANTNDDSEHVIFSTLLAANVDKGSVNYQGFQDSEEFDTYVDYIANKAFTEAASTDNKLAFYINAYNALAIEGILDGSSPSSFFGKIGYFKMDKYTIAGERMNLYDLEHKVIRPFGEPRIHFALVCASTSCPKLRTEAYTQSKLDKQLTENAIDFINDGSKNSFDLKTKKGKISKIFDWFEEDFVEKLSLQKYIAQYVEDPQIKSALNNEALDLGYMKYDWSLNGKL